VLGVNFGTHDAAAAITLDGQVIAAAEEERFTRVKHTKAFPTNAVRYCLETVGADAGDLEAVALFVDPKLQLLLAASNLRQAFPAALGSLRSDLTKYCERRRLLEAVRADELLPDEVRLVKVAHHRAHAASAFLTSPYEEALVVTLDGRGEYETACVFAGRGHDLRRLQHTTYPHSFGYFYSALTRYLGFRPQRDEYKVMGLAAHGSPQLVPLLRQLARIDEATGRIQLDLRFFDHHRRPSGSRSLYSPRLVDLLGPPRGPQDELTDRHRDIAYAVQAAIEDLVVSHLRQIQVRYPHRAICLAGGVALNCVMNARIIESDLFETVYIQPAAGDAGTSIGAALVTSPGRRHELPDMFLGPAFTASDIERAITEGLSTNSFTVTRVRDAHDTAAALLAREQVVGWFAGRMEFGPRALGSRSILASPRRAETTARINAMIKRREEFRPLAPAVLADHAGSYFALRDAGMPVYPFMLATAQSHPRTRDEAPAIVHVDGSARVQTVTRKTSPQLGQVLDRYFARTGVPILLNTSYNLAEEPIVCTPRDAVHTFATANLDALVIGDFVVEKLRVPQK
jgi:carbamoyltransferase